MQFKFFVKVHGEDVTVRKEKFISVRGIKAGRVKYLYKRICAGKSIPKTDERGTHEKRPRKTEESILNSVRDHINNIPKYFSHYSRKENSNRV